jgi:hypothetical protein
MAIQTRLLDDLDGNAEGVRTYLFGLEGARFEIDLTDENLGKLRAALAPFIDVARPAAPEPVITRGTTKPGRVSGPNNAVVRAWWVANHHIEDLPAPNSHGRIPASVVAAYRARR